MGSDPVYGRRPTPRAWRTSSFSSSGGDCVELSGAGAVRDSKDPAAAVVRADLTTLMRAVKAGRLDR
jgi:hypothetical protein